MNKVVMVYITYFASSLLAALLLTPLVRHLAFRVGAVDNGSGRRVHDGVVPRLGGIAIYFAFMAPLVFSLTRGVFDEFHWRMSGIVLAAALVFVTGIFDDFKRASIWMRLAVESGAALVVYFWGVRITALSNPFGGVVQLGWVGLPLTVAWIVIVTNAVNLIDGLDGLAAGTGIMIALTLLILSFSRNPHVNLVFIMLIGSLAGFLFYNFPPASIFMGDSGSLFLGFFLSAFTIISSSKAQAMATMMIPLIAFSMPLMDMAYAVLRRYYRGIPLGKPDREHIHHKLQEKGLGKKKTVLVLYLLNGAVMAIILFFVSSSSELNYLILLAFFLLAVAGLRFLGYMQFRVFFRVNLRNFRISRKRRYINYIIRRFRNIGSNCHDPAVLQRALDALLSEYGLERAEIRFAAQAEPRILYARPGQDRGGDMLELSFPLQSLKPQAALVILTKKIDEDGFLCSSDLVYALNAALVRCLPVGPPASDVR